MFRQGVELSHTHLTIKADDGKSYDVAIDNVFADGYQNGAKSIPAGLSSIAKDDQVQACGQPFPGGIHFVHTKCGDTPSTREPNGWLKKVLADGSTGPNLESSEQYCYLWPHK